MRFLLCALPLVLAQCLDPYGNPMSPFGPTTPPPYTDGREQYRTDMREYDRGQARQAYEHGLREGTADARDRRPQRGQNTPYGPSSANAGAYRDGYEQGYQSSFQNNVPSYPSTPPSYGQAPGYPGGGNNYVPPTPPASNQGQSDPAYNQGYDYGLRDRVAGRQPDAGAYNGKYDPRYRKSFERGYYDAFEARR